MYNLASWLALIIVGLWSGHGGIGFLDPQRETELLDCRWIQYCVLEREKYKLAWKRQATMMSIRSALTSTSQVRLRWQISCLWKLTTEIVASSRIWKQSLQSFVASPVDEWASERSIRLETRSTVSEMNYFQFQDTKLAPPTPKYTEILNAQKHNKKLSYRYRTRVSWTNNLPPYSLLIMSLQETGGKMASTAAVQSRTFSHVSTWQ